MIEENMKFYKGSTFTINRMESIKRNDILYTHTEMDLAHLFHTFFHIYNTCFLLSFIN